MPGDNYVDNLGVLTDLNVTSKDGKCLVPALVNLFESFQTMFKDMFEKLRTDFARLVSAQDEKVVKLQGEISVLSKKISTLEDKIEESESYERRDILILSGKNLPTYQPGENCLGLIPNIFKNQMNLSISPNDISAAYRVGPKPKNQVPDQRSIAVKFCRREVKKTALLAARRTKPADLFVNESLTSQRREIFFCVRKAKREFPDKISGCATIDGSVFLWIKSAVPGARDLRLNMNNPEKFKVFCENNLQKPVSYFLR